MMTTTTNSKATETSNWTARREIARMQMAAERCGNAGQRYTMLAKAEAALNAWRAANPVGAAEEDAANAKYARTDADRAADHAEAQRLIDSGF